MNSKLSQIMPLAMIGLASTVAAAKLAHDGKDSYGWFLFVGLVVAFWVKDLMWRT